MTNTHLGLSLAVAATKTKCNPKRSGRKVWRYAHANFELAQDMLSTIDWNSLFQSSDVNDCWSVWHAKFLQVMETCIPQSTLKTRKNLPWLTKPVVQAMRKRKSCFRAAKRSIMMKRLGTSTSVSETRSLHSYAEARENTFTICSSQPLKNSGKLSK